MKSSAPSPTPRQCSPSAAAVASLSMITRSPSAAATASASGRFVHERGWRMLRSVPYGGRAGRARRCRRRGSCRGRRRRPRPPRRRARRGARARARAAPRARPRSPRGPDLPGEVDDADGEARAHELDPDRVAGVGVDAQRALAAAAVGVRVLDHRAGGEQAAGDVADRLQGQPGRGGDRRPADRPARPHQPQHDDLVVVLHASEVRPPLPRPTLPECHVLDHTQLVNSFALYPACTPRRLLIREGCVGFLQTPFGRLLGLGYRAQP